eukprot:TRINITY_DN3352_c0_g2_i2.p5 TRINITY_DN3352_c0_g2~~TRINITY_DN3352_c0_g2_i2.p5  ORF type:complete len:126 (-),score=33.95 TRINITY_DN3352_c0_g2_i2:114-491(-)
MRSCACAACGTDGHLALACAACGAAASGGGDSASRIREFAAGALTRTVAQLAAVAERVRNGVAAGDVAAEELQRACDEVALEANRAVLELFRPELALVQGRMAAAARRRAALAELEATGALRWLS